MSSRDRAQKSIQSPVAIPANIIAECELPRATKTHGPAEDLQMGERFPHFQEPQDQVTVDKLPDEALLDIFAVYLNDDDRDQIQSVDKWHTLVHVCRRWRDLVFASPRRLDLRLLCTRHRRLKAMLDIWPALPIEINDPFIGRSKGALDNIIAALEHPDRVRSITLHPFSSQVWHAIVAAMQVPFPELTYLWLGLDSTLALPSSFLGGSAPRLRTLTLCNISFPTVSNLLLSASDLVDLSLRQLPHSGYISPEAMVACLSSLNRLESLRLGFQMDRHRSHPDQPSSPPETRVVLPALTDLTFRGATHYLDDFLSRIDTPVLNKFSMSFFLDPVFDVPHLKQFIGRTKGLEPYRVARAAFTTLSIQLGLIGPLPLSLEMMCEFMIDWKVYLMSCVCGQLSPFLSLVERLDITGPLHFDSQGEDDSEFSRFFQPFTAIRSLHVSESIVPLIAPTLQEFIDEGATEVLSNLRDLFLGRFVIPGTVPEVMQPFVNARRLSGQPIDIHHWEEQGADL